jgi:hypothetical protein
VPALHGDENARDARTIHDDFYVVGHKLDVNFLHKKRKVK